MHLLKVLHCHHLWNRYSIFKLCLSESPVCSTVLLPRSFQCEVSSLQLTSKSSSEAEDLSALSAHGIDPSLYQRAATALSSSVPDIVSENVVPTSSSWPENEPRPSGLGLIQATLQHFPIRKRLRVSILKAEGSVSKRKKFLSFFFF